MKNSLLICLVLSVLSACGGKDGGSSSSRFGDRFVGRWSGTYAEQAVGGKSGTLTLTIAREAPSEDHATVSGSLVDGSRGRGGVGGRINDKGDSKLVLTFETTETGEPLPAGEGSTLYEYAGRPKIDKRGHLVASLAYSADGVDHINKFDLAPVPSTTD